MVIKMNFQDTFQNITEAQKAVYFNINDYIVTEGEWGDMVCELEGEENREIITFTSFYDDIGVL